MSWTGLTAHGKRHAKHAHSPFCNRRAPGRGSVEKVTLPLRDSEIQESLDFVTTITLSE